MKYVAIFHANLNYAYLTPDRYEFVIRKSYELIFDVMEQQFPGAKFVFEASGYTLDEIAGRCPDVLVKIRRACEQGRCEFMGSPYAHPMLPNFPKEDGIWSIRFSNESYQKHLGFVPRSFWNPECGWCGYVPEQVVAAGYANMIGDFEAYSRSCGPDGKPLRPEIYEKEHTKERAFYHFGFKYDLPGTERTVHFPFTQVAGLPAEQTADVSPHRPYRPVRRALLHGHGGLHVRQVPRADRPLLATEPRRAGRRGDHLRRRRRICRHQWLVPSEIREQARQHV